MTEVLNDQAVRDLIATDLDRTLFIEAGAGTGKTTAVVDRVVAFICSGRTTIDRLVAITFTEAAAAELRVRIREGLEAVWGDAKRVSVERERCHAAVAGIEVARIETIHAFALALLQTYPLEAGLPPGFVMLTDIDQELEISERFRQWFDDLREGTLAADAVSRALLLGLSLEQLAAAARALHDSYDALTAGTTWQTHPSTGALALANRLGEKIAGLAPYLSDCTSPDELYTLVTELQFAAERLVRAGSEVEALAALRVIERIPSKGSQGNWQVSSSGINACKHLKDELAKIQREAWECLTLYRADAFSAILTLLRDLVLRSAQERKQRGVATFHDLLTWARDLARDNADVRRRAQLRWDRIVVDEFQDTDPLQAELAFYLAADPDRPMPADWRQAPLVPGKLTLVGDPKQSIYRFRRADIAMYDAVKATVVGEGKVPAYLQSNFRSVSRLIGWVNHHFGRVMTKEPGVQPEYVHLGTHHVGTGGGVWVLDEVVAGKQPDVWQAEADAVAACARQVVAEGWRVRRNGGADTAERPARFSDICVLIPTRTNLRRLERAFDDQDVPYRLESGALVVATQEVRDLLACLRAIDDPSDQVALVAALRSPAFGCSDVDLLRWREAGGALTYEYETGDDGRVRRALRDLERFHSLRREMSPAAMVEQVIGERLLVAAAFEQPRPREIWRRYRYVAERARVFATAGRATLREFVDWMETLERDQVRDAGTTAVDDDENAVRVLTVHGAKGLEFPIVILTGLGSRGQFRAPPVIVDRVASRVEAKVGDFQTAGYDALCRRERAMEVAESTRLMYVAATRARDHLVMCLHRGAKTECHASRFAQSARTFEGVRSLPEAAVPSAAHEAAPTAAAAVDVDEHRRGEERWLEHRAERIAALRSAGIQTATGLAHLARESEVPERQDDVAAHRRGRAGTALGRAVHAVLQVIDLATLDGLDDLARAQSSAQTISHRAEEVAELVRAACESEPVRKAVASGRYWREMPVGAPVDGSILEGFIDLLYEDADGRLVVVDYKTDRLSPGEIEARVERYRVQGGAYALLVAAVTGRDVAGVEFVFASLRETRALQDVPGAVAVVRDLLAAGRNLPASSEEAQPCRAGVDWCSRHNSCEGPGESEGVDVL